MSDYFGWKLDNDRGASCPDCGERVVGSEDLESLLAAIDLHGCCVDGCCGHPIWHSKNPRSLAPGVL